MIEPRDLLDAERIVPVVVIDDVDTAEPLAETFVKAGIHAIEVTLRSQQAIDAIELIAANVDEIIVGAGSLRHAEQFKQVKSAGARFGVSPGFTATLLDAAKDADLPLVPGAATASEILDLLQRGFTLQKFFPAEIAGGVKFLKSVGGPIPEVSFMPTGGVSPENAHDYLSLSNVACVGGSWLAPSKLLAARDFDEIGRLAKDAVALAV